ncbi:deoxynucleotide monophosphate kinase family protein [Ochrobactrum sp. BTU1]|uniref:deoxynucleotide monophosphate kinase family protein n=1 Tax=Ochrobactrum sp. BTU1 TaxID=2840456 RepID=UPI001C057033|nr:hypothetical protein KMS41_05060 [Ochrobactrum sp. BTU1]
MASYLVDGHGFQLVKFAGPLKAMLRGYYRELGLTEEEIDRRLEGDLKETPDPHLSGRTPRHAMETLGTEWGRDQMAPEFWTNAAEAKIKGSRADLIVVDDCRFPNEAHVVRRLGGSVVQVKSARGRRKVSKHKAEKGLAPALVDHSLDNNEGIGALRKGIDTFLFGLK